MTTIILFAVVIIGAVVVARMVFARDDGAAPPPLPLEPSSSASPSFVPRLPRKRSAPSTPAPTSSILGLPTDGPVTRQPEDDEYVVYQRLLDKVRDRAQVDRMIEFERVSWPLASRRDWILRAEQRLESQRR